MNTTTCKPWRELSALTSDELDFLSAEVSRKDLPEGSILCAGVYKGGDVIEIYQSLATAGRERQLIIIDSFSGLADPSLEDMEGTDAPMLAGECDCEGLGAFTIALEEYGVQDYELFIQWIDDETLTRLETERRLSMIWLDLDHYTPTLACMKKFWPWLELGGLMLTHDYGFERCPGIKRAADQISTEWQHMVGGIYGLRKKENCI